MAKIKLEHAPNCYLLTGGAPVEPCCTCGAQDAMDEIDRLTDELAEARKKSEPPMLAAEGTIGRIFDRLQKVSEPAPRAILCIYCGTNIPYDPNDREKAYEIMKEHDLTCAKNPLVQRIKELEAKPEPGEFTKEMQIKWHGMTVQIKPEKAPVSASLPNEIMRDLNAACKEIDRLTAELKAKNELLEQSVDFYLKTLEERCWDLRCIDIPTGGGDFDIGWIVVGHYLTEPKEHIIGRGKTPSEAIEQALKEE